MFTLNLVIENVTFELHFNIKNSNTKSERYNLTSKTRL